MPAEKSSASSFVYVLLSLGGVLIVCGLLISFYYCRKRKLASKIVDAHHKNLETSSKNIELIEEEEEDDDDIDLADIEMEFHDLNNVSFVTKGGPNDGETKNEENEIDGNE